MAQRHRTRTYRRVKKKTPGGRLKIEYTKRKPSHKKCAQCKKILKGVPRDLPYKVNKLSKSQKKPERPFGGYLCSECMRKEIKQRFNISKQVPFEVGQVAVKLAGKEAGRICVVVEKLDKNFVSIDGQTKRKRCNIIHLAPLEQKINLKDKSTHADVVKELKKLKIDIQETKPKEKKPKPKRKVKEKKVEKTKTKKQKPKKEVTNKNDKHKK